MMKKILCMVGIGALMFGMCSCKNVKKIDLNNQTEQSAQVTQEATNDQSVEDVIKEARNVASYFYFDNHDANYYDESVSETVDGRQWCKVTDTRFNTKEAAKEFLQTEFSSELADKMLNYALEQEFFKEIDGNLYALVGDGGRLVNSSEYSVAEKTDDKITYNVVIEYLGDEDANGNPVNEKKEYTFVREKINGKWVFTQFEYVW